MEYVYRDISFYILATLSIIIFGIHGEINLTSAIVLLTLYVLQVIIVLFQ